VIAKPTRREKDVALLMAAHGRTTKIPKSAPKTWPAMLTGFVEKKAIKCGKANCKCAGNERHGAYFYLVYRQDGRRKREYVSLSDLPTVLLACKVHRDLQAQLWQGRAAYQRALAQARALLRMLSL